jgi:hypothetical protein
VFNVLPSVKPAQIVQLTAHPVFKDSIFLMEIAINVKAHAFNV